MSDEPPPEITSGDLEIIRMKVGKLMRHGFNRHDREDAAQHVAIEVFKQLKRFDPARGNREAFVNVVAQSKVLSYIETTYAAKRDDGQRPRSLHGLDGELLHDPQDHEADTPELDTMVFAGLIASLPPHLGEFARLKMGLNGAKVQQRLGITRGRYRQLEQELKACLERWLEASERNPKKSSTATTTFKTVPVVDSMEIPFLPSRAQEQRP